MSRGGTGFGGNENDFDAERRRRALVNETERDIEMCSYLNVTNQTLVFSTQGSDAAWLYNFLHSSESTKMVDTIKELFRNQVPTDWPKRQQLYQIALQVCSTLASDLQLATLFGTTAQSDSLLNALLQFSRQAELVAQRSASSDHDLTELLLATQVLEVKDKAARVVSQLEQQQQPNSSPRSLIATTTTQTPPQPRHSTSTSPPNEDYYKQLLGPLRFSMVNELRNHAFDDYTPPHYAMDTRHIFRELASYQTTLPVEFGSSIFVRAVDQSLDKLRCCIIGPDNTPYANGVFIFDVLLPPSYPHAPPKVQFRTTGNGAVRFNPNLYSNGKVCLSLLGTWEGPSWIPGESTLLQVLISIQSLILVPDPFFNEPDWSDMQDSPEGREASSSYNAQIRFQTQHLCIQDFLQSLVSDSLEYPEFKEVLVNHFLVKSVEIDQQSREWSQIDPSMSNSTIKVCRLLKLLARKHPEIARKPPASSTAPNASRMPRMLPEVGSIQPASARDGSTRSLTHQAQQTVSRSSSFRRASPSNAARRPPEVSSNPPAPARPGDTRTSLQRQRSENLKFTVTVPENVRPGEQFEVLAMGRLRPVVCPRNARPGDPVEFFIPKKVLLKEEAEAPLPEEQVQSSPNVMPINGGECYVVKIPPNISPGQQFNVMIDGHPFFVKCPMNSGPGGAVKIFPPRSSSHSTSRSASPNVSGHSVDSDIEEEQGTVTVKIPSGVQPGKHFAIDRDGTRLVVTCPPHARPGDLVRYKVNRPGKEIAPYAEAMAPPQEQLQLERQSQLQLERQSQLQLVAAAQPSQAQLRRQQQLTQPRQLQSQRALRSYEEEVTPVTIYYNRTEEWARVLSTENRKFYWKNIGGNNSESFNINKLALARKLVLLPNNTGHRAGHLSLVRIADADFESEAKNIEGNTFVSGKDLERIQAQPVEERVKWFRSQCTQLRVNLEEGHMIINVRPKFLLTDSVKAVMSLSRHDLRKTWKFRHVGGAYMDNLEEFQWYQNVMKDLFDPDLGLWQYTNAVNQLRMQIHPASEFCCEEHLLYFRFCGRIMGKALLEGRHLISAPLDAYIYKILIGWPILFQDLEHVNEEHYKHLKMLDAWDKRGEGVSLLCLNFTTTSQVLGNSSDVELVPGGANISVTNDNFQQYLEASLKYRLVECVKPQLTELLLGFFDVIPEALLAVFDYIELEQLLMFKATTPYDAF